MFVNQTTDDMELVNSKGVDRVMTNAQMEQAVGESQADVELGYGPTPEPAGPNILLMYGDGSTTTFIAVVSGITGKVLGRGTAPNTGGQIVGSPSGTEWAWIVDLGTNATGHSYGKIELAGLGVAPHTIFDWTAPIGYGEAVTNWTDAGIILQRMSNSDTCIQNYAYGNAAFLVSPTTGALTNLFSESGEQYLYVTKEVQVSGFYAAENAVYIQGASYKGDVYSDEDSELVQSADPSPDGVHVVVNRVGFDGTCNVITAQDFVELINGVTESRVDYANIQASGWLNDDEFIASAPNASGAWLYNLQGKPVQLLAGSPWLFQGVVSG
jgi:hypothetical protein